jgi:hypothetical protein
MVKPKGERMNDEVKQIEANAFAAWWKTGGFQLCNAKREQADDFWLAWKERAERAISDVREVSRTNGVVDGWRALTIVTERKQPAYDVMKARAFIESRYEDCDREKRMERLGMLVDFLTWEWDGTMKQQP